ncbi:MAG TPA: LytTR family DNA-binding domain-containing protein [Burkholderiales bacterium]|nr:LytTR family DNA-binding domain-containing protein [Burkholderiales bacterium]
MTPPLLRVAIVDDEAPARSRLRDLLADCAEQQPLEIVGEADSGADALELVSAQPTDVVLLDIRMPGMDGIETAQHLRKFDNPPLVIFTTAYDAYALKAFEVHAIDYLLKPIRAARLLEALAMVRSKAAPKVEALAQMRHAPRTSLSAGERGKVHLIPVSSIIYLRAELKYVTVRTREREHLVEESLTRLEEEFGEKFVRVHRSCLVARAAIRGFERASGTSSEGVSGEGGQWEVLLNGCDERIAVSRRQQHIVREFSK